jgi:hypothetical protein
MKMCKLDFGLITIVALLCLPLPVLAQVTADEVLAEMEWSGDEKKQILAGEFVTGQIKSVSDRDLAISMGFLVKVPPNDLAKEVVAGNLMKANTQIKAHGGINGDGSLKDFEALNLSEADDYLNAKPGDKLNLDAQEIAAFKALKGKPNATQAAKKQLHKMLLARYQAYRKSGLTGISPYDRGKGKKTDPGKDLLLNTDAARVLKKYVPSFQKVMVGYPKATITGLDEQFFWIQYGINGKPNYVLSHFFSAPAGDARVVVKRQFYVANTYNVMQEVAGFIPVKEGTLVVYVNHLSTGHVAGFGGSAKRKIGGRTMAKKIKELFKKSRSVAEQ